MLFGGEPRFHKKQLKPSRSSDIAAYGESSETADHVGPGTYFVEDIEKKRMGWSTNSFRSPQSKSSPNRSKNSDRSMYYMNATLTSTGIALPTNLQQNTPGPGDYNKPIVIVSPPRPKSSEKSKYMGTSKRMSSELLLRNGIIVHCPSNYYQDSPGPGYHSPSNTDTTLISKSYNIHAQQHSRVRDKIEDNSIINIH